MSYLHKALICAFIVTTLSSDEGSPELIPFSFEKKQLIMIIEDLAKRPDSISSLLKQLQILKLSANKE